MHKQRCSWVPLHKPHYVRYHDEEWGVPVYDDRKLFELLSLEGAQAGLSWETILNKRENYNTAFHGFDPEMCARMSDAALEKLMHYDGIVRNRLKIFSVRKNALAYIRIQKEFGTFSNYIWGFLANKTRMNTWTHSAQVPASTPLSDSIARDLKKRNMNFVGSTVVYAFMQAAGLVNDHTIHCFRYRQCS
ncbi:MAG: DNA-3-methyladenine glycosylase I [Bacteroidota bacterium]